MAKKQTWLIPTLLGPIVEEILAGLLERQAMDQEPIPDPGQGCYHGKGLKGMG
jgi:hypothetical protein